MATKHQRSASNKVDLSSNPWIKTISRGIIWIVNGHWWIIGLVVLPLVAFEVYDFTQKQNNTIHIVELFIFLVLLLIIGLMIVSLSQGISNQRRIIRVLETKHKLSLELSGYQDWDALVDKIARFPGSLASVRQTCLFVSNIITNQFALAAQWNYAEADPADQCSEEACEECVRNASSNDLTFRLCDTEVSTGGSKSQAQNYCLPIKDNERLLGVLQFSLEPGKALTEEQVDIFRNIGDNVAVALRAGQDRKVWSDLRTSETALAERRSVSNYLHDHLGQNLGYLHLKMDQLLMEKDQLSLERVLADLELMRSAAFESYEIVRGVLETIHPETNQTLSNLLLEHARKISRRSDIDIDFKTRGNPVMLPEETQRAIFYAFQESLSNVEKHARATRVKILAEWNPDHFALTISDNGIGFNPQFVNTEQHFGLEILNERMARVNGRITLNTMEDSGTVVYILVPSVSQGQLGAGA